MDFTKRDLDAIKDAIDNSLKNNPNHFKYRNDHYTRILKYIDSQIKVKELEYKREKDEYYTYMAENGKEVALTS